MNSLDMHIAYVKKVFWLLSCLELLHSPYVSLASPVKSVVFPRLLEERSDGGELLVAIRAGQTLSLRKASVLPKELEVTTLEDGKEVIHYMNGTRLQEDLYHDPEARAAVILTRSTGIRLVGILSPTERIEPAASRPFGSKGLVRHNILPIALKRVDVDNTRGVSLQGIDIETNSTLPDANKEMGSVVLEERSGHSVYPVKAICETRFVVDSKYYHAFQKNKQQLVKYLAVHAAFANLKFRTFQSDIVQLQLSVTGIVILSQQKEKFIERYHRNHGDSIMLSATLEKLNEFVRTESRFRHDDVVVLFTGLDMGVIRRYPADINTDIIGLANLKGACGPFKAAIVEDLPRTFSSVHTLVHEIGHLLGSQHDGSLPPENAYIPIDPRRCPDSDKYIMAPVQGTRMKHDFSYCSAVQVAHFLLSEGKCLTKNGSSLQTKKLRFPDVNSTRPSLDVFCERHYTEYPGTAYKKNSYPTLSLEKCIITCSDPNRPQTIIINDAPDGTPCDDKKRRMICINGKCTRVKHNYVLTFGSDVENSVLEL